MNYTQSIGDIVELQCMSKFIELGYEVSIPYGNGAKYDFIVDINGKFIRIQCKSCSHPKIKKTINEYDQSAIQIATISQTTNTQKTVRHLYTKQQIDYFATYYNQQVYLIPVEQCSTSKTLRFTPPKNGNKNYNKAEDYEIEKIIPYSEELLSSKIDFEDKVEQNRFKQLKIEQRNLYCLNCGKEITLYSKSGLCNNCYKETTRTVKRPNREELKNMIRKETFTSIGRKYGVTDNAIRKWCISEKLPSKKKDIKLLTDDEWSKI